MEQFVSLLNTYSDYITITIFILFIVALIAFLKVLKSLNNVKKQYQSLLKGMSNRNLEEIILNNAQEIEFLKGYLKENDARLETLNKRVHNCLKNVAMKKYNAFDGVGGEQSFSLAMLDDLGNGIIITSIHGRDDARTYAKPITEGRSKYSLSEEEKLVLSITLNT